MEIVRNKRGDVSDIITFVIITFFLATSLLIAAFANDLIKESIETTPLNGTQVAQDSIAMIDGITTTGVQSGFLTMVAFLIIGMMISSFMVRIHPIFLFLYIIFLAITLFVSVPLANSYQLLMSADAIAATAAKQTFITWVMQHLLGIVLGVGALSMMIVFGKLRSPQGGGDV